MTRLDPAEFAKLKILLREFKIGRSVTLERDDNIPFLVFLTKVIIPMKTVLFLPDCPRLCCKAF